MQGRFRNLEDETIRVLLKETKPAKSQTYEEFLSYYDERRRVMNDAICSYSRFYPEFTHFTVKYGHPTTLPVPSLIRDLKKAGISRVICFKKRLIKGTWYMIIETME